MNIVFVAGAYLLDSEIMLIITSAQNGGYISQWYRGTSMATHRVIAIGPVDPVSTRRLSGILVKLVPPDVIF